MQLTTKQSIAFCLVSHVVIYIASFLYYGAHPTVEWQVTDPTGQPVTVSNIPGLVVVTGALALSAVPLIWESFEFKRNNPLFWENVDANIWNSLVSIPTMWLVLEWICRDGMYVSEPTITKTNWKPILMDAACFLLISDAWFYWSHRLFHEVDCLWRHHLLHHRLNPAKHVTAIAAASTSAVDLTLTHLPMFWFPFLVKSFDFFAVVLAMVFMIFWLPFIHSSSFWTWNTGFLMDPTNHRVHHSWGRKNNYNFGGYTLFWDKVMGTYRSEDSMKVDWAKGNEEETAYVEGTKGKAE